MRCQKKDCLKYQESVGGRSWDDVGYSWYFFSSCFWFCFDLFCCLVLFFSLLLCFVSLISVVPVFESVLLSLWCCVTWLGWCWYFWRANTYQHLEMLVLKRI